MRKNRENSSDEDELSDLNEQDSEIEESNDEENEAVTRELPLLEEQSVANVANLSLGNGIKKIVLESSAKTMAESVHKPALSKSQKPTTKVMVDTAIKALAEPKGSSYPAIQKYIKSNYTIIDEQRLSLLVKKYVKMSIIRGNIVQKKNSYKLAKDHPDNKEKKPIKKKAKKIKKAENNSENKKKVNQNTTTVKPTEKKMKTVAQKSTKSSESEPAPVMTVAKKATKRGKAGEDEGVVEVAAPKQTKKAALPKSVEKAAPPKNVEKAALPKSVEKAALPNSDETTAAKKQTRTKSNKTLTKARISIGSLAAPPQARSKPTKESVNKVVAGKSKKTNDTADLQESVVTTKAAEKSRRIK